MPIRFGELRRGPERSLIDWFLSKLRVPTRTGYEVSIFREPAIESGLPDVVIVVWKPGVARAWSPARAELAKNDFKLAHLMVRQGPQTAPRLQELSCSPIEPVLARLESAQLIYRRGSRWRTRPLREIFAATEIIAVEAKMSDWRRGLEQASTNRWFASASYLLMPRAPQNDAFWAAAKAAGVGVWIKDGPPRRSAVPGSLPCSYASWLFHDSAWRQSLR